jgi:hypothetical protein
LALGRARRGRGRPILHPAGGDPARRRGTAWLAALAFAAHLPWNLVLLVGVWRSAGRPEVGRDAAFLARIVMLGWAVALSLL